MHLANSPCLSASGGLRHRRQKALCAEGLLSFWPIRPFSGSDIYGIEKSCKKVDYAYQKREVSIESILHYLDVGYQPTDLGAFWTLSPVF